MHRLGQNGQKLSGKTVGRDKVKKGWLRESHPLLPSRLEPPNQNLLGLSLHFSSFLMVVVGGGCSRQDRVSLCVTLAILELTL